MQSIINSFPVTNEEYNELDRRFGKLCHHQSWQLLKKNVNNNCSDDREDMLQEIRIALLRAGSYYKRQTYIEDSLSILEKHVSKNQFASFMLKELQKLWGDRTRHGANRQKFGEFQEFILDRLVQKYVPKDQRPERNRPLQLDAKFVKYCKQITWNEQRHMGKKITREKSFRGNMISLSEFDHISANVA